MEFQTEVIAQLTRIEDELKKMNEDKGLASRDTLTNETERELTDSELRAWVSSFTEQQRNFINGHIKTMILCNFAHEMEPLSPAIARLIREYV